MERLMLSEIAGALGAECPFEAEIKEISTDTRTLPEGCLFVAIKGDRFDGHDFIPKAIEDGAVAALSGKKIEGCPCVVVDDTRKAYLNLAGYYRRKFSPVLVGVTGSVGKTTTKEMIALVLSERFSCLKTKGNLNNEIGLPRTLFSLDSTHQAAVIEMGMSDFGEISRLARTCAPTIGVITNIGFAHIENLKTQEGILKAKLEILDGMDAGAPLVVNGDDPHLSGLGDVIGSRPFFRFGIDNEECDCKASGIEESGGKTSFTVTYDGESHNVTLPCVGRHNVLNALAAYCVGSIAGMTGEEIASALGKYQPDGMRQNIVKKGGVTVIIDCYNASPDSMKASIGVLAGLKTEGRKIAVLGDMLELGKESEKLHYMVGRYISDTDIDRVFCYGHDAVYIMRECGKKAYFAGMESRDLLSEKIRDYIKDGDTVLFKASRGMRFEEIIEKVFDGEDK